MRLETGVVAWLRLVRAYSKLERRSQGQLRECGLTGAQFDVLAQVGAREGCTQQELAEALLVTKGNVTQLLDRMEAAGWLKRTAEGRTKRVSLTREGRAVRRRVLHAHETFMAAQLASLSADEQRTLAGLLRTLDRALDQTDGADQGPGDNEGEAHR